MIASGLITMISHLCLLPSSTVAGEEENGEARRVKLTASPWVWWGSQSQQVGLPLSLAFFPWELTETWVPTFIPSFTREGYLLFKPVTTKSRFLNNANTCWVVIPILPVCSKGSLKWTCIIWHEYGHVNDHMPQTHRNVKTFPWSMRKDQVQVPHPRCLHSEMVPPERLPYRE